MEDEDQKRFTRRALLLGGGKGLLLTSLVARMHYLQVEMADHYKVLADKNRILMRLIIPPRGHLVDRDGIVLATNNNVYRAIVQRHLVEDMLALLKKLQKLLRLPDEEMQRMQEDLRKKPRFIPLKIKEDLLWDEVSRLELHLPDLPGLSIERGKNRYYKSPFEMCHVIGYVSTVAEEDLDGDPLLLQPGFRIGKRGLEKFYEDKLRGKAGIKQVEVNAARRVVRELDTKSSAPGEDMQLTIDYALQKKMAERLRKERSAAAVIMDVNTGDILAMYSHPTYDTNLFTHGISGKDWRRLLHDPSKPLLDKTVLGQYAPGSTFKVMVALAALEEGVITPSTRISCPGYQMLGSHRFNCWKRGGHGSMNLDWALPRSCDVYFYNVAAMVGADPIARVCNQFGMGVKTGIDLPIEKPGLIPTTTWKKMIYGDKWRRGDSYNTGIGQGYVLSTPLQLAVMTARVANGGRAVVPRLVIPNGNEPIPEPELINIKPENLALIQQGMDNVVNRAGGTAGRSKITIPGQEMAGKTGTSQVRSYSASERARGMHKFHNQKWEDKDHALFICYSPVDKPRFSCAVVVEHGGGGSRAAAPVAKELLMAAHELIPEKKV